MKSGDLVVDAHCPSCGATEVVYNGNYWCISCQWAMTDRETPAERAIVARYLAQRLKWARANGDRFEVETMERYLLEYKDVRF